MFGSGDSISQDIDDFLLLLQQKKLVTVRAHACIQQRLPRRRHDDLGSFFSSNYIGDQALTRGGIWFFYIITIFTNERTDEKRHCYTSSPFTIQTPPTTHEPTRPSEESSAKLPREQHLCELPFHPSFLLLILLYHNLCRRTHHPLEENPPQTARAREQ